MAWNRLPTARDCYVTFYDLMPRLDV